MSGKKVSGTIIVLSPWAATGARPKVPDTFSAEDGRLSLICGFILVSLGVLAVQLLILSASIGG
jgi:hypothetical protein